MHSFDRDFHCDFVVLPFTGYESFLKMFNVFTIIVINSKISDCLYIGGSLHCFQAIQHKLFSFLLI